MLKTPFRKPSGFLLRAPYNPSVLSFEGRFNNGSNLGFLVVSIQDSCDLKSGCKGCSKLLWDCFHNSA